MKLFWCFFLLFQLTAAHHLDNIQQCFDEGSNYGKSVDHNCSHPPIIFAQKSSQTCLSAFKSSCFESHQILSCEKGIEHALKNEICNHQQNSAFSKCCNACSFGIEIQSSHGSCESILKFHTSSIQVMSKCCEHKKSIPIQTSVENQILPVEESPIDIIESPVYEVISSQENSQFCSTYPSLCGNDETCVDLENSYKCVPSLDTELSMPATSRICEQYSSLCGENEICVDTEDFYFCECNEGFSRNESKCVDDDECSLSVHKCGGDQLCKNTIGSYECISVDCPSGFEAFRSGDGYDCNLVNECLTSPCADGFKCENVEGGFKCNDLRVKNCEDGFEFLNETCIDINECEKNSCAGEEICTNLKGSFRCEKIECEENYEKFYESKCQHKKCRPHDMKCKGMPRFISHIFKVVKNSDENLVIFNLFGFENLIGHKTRKFDHVNFKVLKKGAEILMKNAPKNDTILEVKIKLRDKYENIFQELKVVHVYVEIE